MSYFVYILYSPSIGQYYTGSCEDIETRLSQHNNSGSKATKKANDWIVRYQEVFLTRSEAVTREVEIKKKKSRKYIEWLLSSTI